MCMVSKPRSKPVARRCSLYNCNYWLNNIVILVFINHHHFFAYDSVTTAIYDLQALDMHDDSTKWSPVIVVLKYIENRIVRFNWLIVRLQQQIWMHEYWLLNDSCWLSNEVENTRWETTQARIVWDLTHARIRSVAKSLLAIVWRTYFMTSWPLPEVWTFMSESRWFRNRQVSADGALKILSDEKRRERK